MAKVDIPQTFKFMAQTWRVEPGTTRDIGQDLGQCNRDTCTIYLNPDYPYEVRIQTFMHELVHCWETVLNQHLTEDQVDNISMAMFHWFRENPEFIPLFVHEEDINE